MLIVVATPHSECSSDPRPDLSFNAIPRPVNLASSSKLAASINLTVFGLSGFSRVFGRVYKSFAKVYPPGDPAILATVDGTELLGVGDDCSSETMSSDAEGVPAVHPAARTRSLALDRAPASALPMRGRAISQKRAARSTLDDLCEEEPAKRIKIVSDVDEESNEEEENESDQNVDVDGEVVSETGEEDAEEDEEEEEEEVEDEGEDEEEDEDVNEAAERMLEAFARQTIVQSLWDLTGTILDLPENCGQAGVREMYFRCIQVGLRLSEARVRAGNLSTAAMNARIARGIPVSADEAQKYARTIHLSVFQPMALGALEVIPVVANVDETAEYLSLVASVDAVIDAVGGTNLSTLSQFLLDATADAVQAHRSPSAPKLTYIHTSGTWVHGENRSDVVGDTSPLRDTPALVTWRPAQEQRVITNPLLNGIVIRPALLYGKPGGRLALIHCDDLAELYLLAAEKAAIAGGKIFDAANDVNESTDAFLQRLVEVSGGTKPYAYTEPTNEFEAALNTTTIIRPYLGRALLGWQARKAGLLDHMHIYYNAWKASEGLS
ncbi:hypothetical protein ACG7TL_007010 [Trametes sanguinea]